MGDAAVDQATADNAERMLPMFPLGTTVFPTQLVPLHIFEERYRTLMAELTSEGADAIFGVVLIERGFEVGGGDHRVDVGTMVEILQAQEFEDGRWGVVAAGVGRIDVVEWLDDKPYPQAIIRPRSVRDTGGASLDDLAELLLGTLRLAAEIAGEQLQDEYEFSPEPIERLDQLSALAPLTTFDRQQVLEAPTTTDQIALLSRLLEEKRELLVSQVDRG